MAKGYEDLSRRALIQLGKDYDQVSDAALMNYLAENSDNYEGIRPIEKVIVKADKIANSVKCTSSVLKDIAKKESDSIISAVIDAVVTASMEAESKLGELKGLIES